MANGGLYGTGNDPKSLQALQSRFYATGHVPMIPLPGTQVPTTTTILQPLLQKLQQIPKPTLPTFAPLAQQFASQAPVPLARPTPEFYQNLMASRVLPIQQQYFDPGGVAAQTTTELNKRGLLTGGPSGVSGQLYQQTVTEPYTKRVAEVQNQINILQSETELQLSQLDAQRQDNFRRFQADVALADRDVGLRSAEAQARIDQDLLRLEAEITRVMAAGATEEDLQRLNQQVQLFEIMGRQRALEQEHQRELTRLDLQRGQLALQALSTPGALEGPWAMGQLGLPPILPQNADEYYTATGYRLPGGYF